MDTATSQTTKSQLGAREIFFKYLRFLPLFIISGTLAILAAFAYMRYAPKVYSATGTMIIKSNEGNGQNSDKFSLLLEGKSQSSDIQNELEIIKSLPVLTRVVDRMGLNFSYQAIGTITKNLNIYKDGPFLVSPAFIKDSSSSFTILVTFVKGESFTINGGEKTYTYGEQFTTPEGRFSLKRNKPSAPPAGSAYNAIWNGSEATAEQIQQSLRVIPKVPGAAILAVTVENTNAHMAADVVNNLMVQYDSITIEENRFSSNLMEDFVQSSMAKIKPEIEELKAAGLAIQQAHNLYDIETKSAIKYESLSVTDKLINENQLQADNIDLITSYLGNNRNKYKNVSPSALGIEDPELNSLIDKYNAAQMEREQLIKGNVPEGNPLFKPIDASITDYRNSILANLNNLKTAYKSGIV